MLMLRRLCRLRRNCRDGHANRETNGSCPQGAAHLYLLKNAGGDGPILSPVKASKHVVERSQDRAGQRPK
jgi:hypothetical protein